MGKNSYGAFLFEFDRQQRSKNMAAIQSQGTKIERLFLGGLVERGLDGFAFHAGDLPGTPDAAHREARIAVFLDGCFWHGCPKLEDAGWLVRRIWGHSVRKQRARRWWLTRLSTLVEQRCRD